MEKYKNYDSIASDITKVLDRAFEALKGSYKHNQEINMKEKTKDENHLVFPKYRDDTTRISEQELRFAFINQLLEAKDLSNTYYYSVETPTKEKYRFSKKDRDDFDQFGIDRTFPRLETDKDRVYDKAHKGKVKNYHSICESAQFDTVIHDTDGNRIAYIEFKGMDSNRDDYKKDFLKLNTEGYLKNEENEEKELVPCFFVQLLKTKSFIANKRAYFSDKKPELSTENIICIQYILGDD